MSRSASSILFVALLGCLRTGTVAAGDCDKKSDDCVAVGDWNFSLSLGGGVRTNPLVNSRDIPLAVIPHVSYYGSRLFLDNLDLGSTIVEGARSTLSVIASPGYDRVFFYRNDLQNYFVSGLATTTSTGHSTPVAFPHRSRRIAYLAGPEWTGEIFGASAQLDLLQTITGQRGQEMRAALGLPLKTSAGQITANAGLTWKSSAIVNYYYGAPGIYQGGSAVNPFFRLGYTSPTAGRWRFNAFAEYERLGSAIADSPIVAEHHVLTVFAGAVYAF